MASKVKGGEKVVDVLIKSGADPDTAKEVIALQNVNIYLGVAILTSSARITHGLMKCKFVNFMSNY